jgi:hypothetical protein
VEERKKGREIGSDGYLYASRGTGRNTEAATTGQSNGNHHSLSISFYLDLVLVAMTR